MTDATTIKNCSLLKQSLDHLEVVTVALEALAQEAPWATKGYLDATQHDQLERLFFRFLVSRNVLVSLALIHKNHTDHGEAHNENAHNENAHSDSSFQDPHMNDESHACHTLTALAAGISLFVYEGRFVLAFQKDKVAVSKLNEEFHRSAIPRDTFRQLSLECTDITPNGRLVALQNAYGMYDKERESLVAGTMGDSTKDDPAKELSEEIDSLHQKALEIRKQLLSAKDYHSLLKNEIQHSKAADHAHQFKGYSLSLMRQVRAHTYQSVSRLKSPTAYLISFSDQQKQDVLSQLQPGDMIFTYTAGYMSDVFIPGAFKHGITYVGSPEDRANAGLTAESIANSYNDLPEGEASKLLEQFQVSTVPNNNAKGAVAMDANVIEAVAEGVILNNLSFLMDTHVNRLLVLRPTIADSERTDALLTLFRYLGTPYDFGFNFANGSAVVCTEIQYHAFNGKGQLHFELVKHTGHLSLSADDIANYYLMHPGSFEFVLLALEDPETSHHSKKHSAKIYTGEDGKLALADLMASA